MGHGAWGMGHGAWGMGHLALSEVEGWGMGHGAWGNSPPLPFAQSGDSSGGSSIAPHPPKFKSSHGGFDRTNQ
ncbi:hypothetical protein [Microcoleus sp. bin38.metabat.b11b12b14.051]|uniref:hypothetical protein n=1 Tax=Microcoleus sp. bin38.metabat.b11b12b14.051 TaxID=2742709 RepID=UPI0025FA93AC|nr:hypothetical protein [Microcoleus sp. bin38.metabat.b11b12b14.051]